MKVLFAFCIIFTWSRRSKGSSPSCLDNLQCILLTLAGRRTVPFFCSVLGTEKWKPDQRQLLADPIDYYKVCRVSVTVSIVLHGKSSFILSIKTTGSSNGTPKRRPDRGVDLALEKHGCFFFFYKNSTTPIYWLCLVLQLSPIYSNGAELQYQTEPLEVLFIGSSHVFIMLYSPFKRSSLH